MIRAADLPVLALRADYAFLERLLLLDLDTLYALTLNRFAAALSHPSPLPGFEDLYREFLQRWQASDAGKHYSSSRFGRPLLGEWDYHTFFLPVSSTKVCPVCLEETEAYDRLYWRTRFLTICPRHTVFLRERCPACYSAIPSLRSSPTTCPNCGKGDYRTTPCSLQPYLREASCLLAGDLLTLKTLGLPATSWPAVLTSLSLQQYFSLLHSFCKLLKLFSADYLLTFLTHEYHAVLARLQGSRQVVPLRDTGVQIAITHWLFASWPDHLFALLDALQLWSLQWSFRPSFEDLLPQLFIGREGDEAYAFLDQAYRRYQSTYGRQGYAALRHRVQQRLDAFGNIPYDSLRG